MKEQGKDFDDGVEVDVDELEPLRIGNAHKVSQTNMCKVLGVTDRTLRKYKGCPRNDDARETYPLPEVIKWIRASYEAEIAELNAALSGDKSGSPALERYRNARADREELDLAERCGQLVERESVHSSLGFLASLFRELGARLQKSYDKKIQKHFDKTLDSFESYVKGKFGGKGKK